MMPGRIAARKDVLAIRCGYLSNRLCLPWASIIVMLFDRSAWAFSSLIDDVVSRFPTEKG